MSNKHQNQTCTRAYELLFNSLIFYHLKIYLKRCTTFFEFKYDNFKFLVGLRKRIQGGTFLMPEIKHEIKHKDGTVSKEFVPKVLPRLGKTSKADEKKTKAEVKKEKDKSKLQKEEKKQTKEAKDKPKTEVKTRFFSGVLYPESLPENWLAKLKSLSMAGAVSPLHNLDWQVADWTFNGIYPDGKPKKVKKQGLKSLYACFNRKERPKVQISMYAKWVLSRDKEPDWKRFDAFGSWVKKVLNPVLPEADKIQVYKKAHYHWILIADKPMTAKTMMRRLQKVLGEHAVSFALVQPIKTTVWQMYQYFTHESLEAKLAHKHVYDANDISTFNGFDIDAFKTYSPEQKRYCAKLFSYLSIVGQEMKKLTGVDYLELTSLHTSQLRMASPDALKYYLEEYAKPMMTALGQKRALAKFTAKYTNELAKISDAKNKKADVSKPKKFEYHSIDADNSKKSREQLLTDKLFDAEHARRELSKQEIKLKSKGEDADRLLQNSEISAVLGFVNYLLNALDDVNSWPDKALFFQSYLAYRNVYRDYMNVNSKKW